MDNLKISIPGKPEYLTMIRLVSGSLASVAGFDVDCIEDIKTSIAEACKIVSCHGEEGFSDKYEIDCNIDKNYLDITVRDDCDMHSIEKIKKPCLHCPQEGDIGKIVIRSLMNEVEFGRDEKGHKFVKMVKKI